MHHRLTRRPSRGAEQVRAGRTAAALTHDRAPRSRGKHSGSTTTTPSAAITSRLSASTLSAPDRRSPPTRHQGARLPSHERVQTGAGRAAASATLARGEAQCGPQTLAKIRTITALHGHS
jgi:hypothetical protein